MHQMGFKVCLLEKGEHPRFALGESSTPIADMVLRDIAQKYALPWLNNFSRYGTWQTHHPDIVCGLKRGFSYYKHTPNQAFQTDSSHSHELLVAASASDTLSDTNWLRADFDNFLVEKVKEYGIDYFDQTSLSKLHREQGQWKVQMQTNSASRKLNARFIVDATGNGFLLDKLFAVQSSSDTFQTHSFAVYSHFEHIIKWADVLKERNISTKDYPYRPDDSALHHLLDEAWVWSLRFNNGRTSFGFMVDGTEKHLSHMPSSEIVAYFRRNYPDIDLLLQKAELSRSPGRILATERLQRRAQKCYGEGWVALPHTAGFVDPMFSTGIAQSLTGIEKLADSLSAHFNNPSALLHELESYQKGLFDELKLIDILVAGCYKSLRHFPLFRTWTMLYFALTIQYEQRRLQQQPFGSLLCAENPELFRMVQESYYELEEIIQSPKVSQAKMLSFEENIRQKIAPLNSAGLLNPAAKNMYWHTAANF